ncbi:MAG: DUF2484 family protein [Alphaproteobacteria bacterium]|nr:MAG: DUF2484 family protein [Alphaproteobacteria bacterium]
MTLSLTLACLWALAASVIALLPSRRKHWPQAWALIATGLPLLGFVLWQNGPLIALAVAAAGASVLRWPLFYGLKWLARRLGMRERR